MHASRALRGDEVDLAAYLQVARLLPADPARQVELAQGIIHEAFRQAAAQMASELQHLRAAVADKDSRIRSLEDSLAACQDSLQDARSQVRHACAAPGVRPEPADAPAQHWQSWWCRAGPRTPEETLKDTILCTEVC